MRYELTYRLFDGIESTITAKHPDLAKQELERRIKGKWNTVKAITILDRQKLTGWR